MTNFKSQLAHGVKWVAVTRVLLSALGLVSTVVLARLLTPADFGLVAIATAVLAIAQSLTQLSLTSALIQRREVAETDIHTVWTLSAIRAVMLTAVLAALSPLIANLYDDARLVNVMLVTALSGGISALLSPMVGLQAKTLQFKTQFLVQLVQRASVLIVSTAISVIWHSYWALVIGTFVSVSLSTAWSYFIVPYRPRFSVANFKSLFSYSMWLSLTQLLSTLNWRFDQLILGSLASKVDLGHYVMADNIASIPVREATQPVSQVLFPGFSLLNADTDRLRPAFLLAQSTLVFVSFPLGFGFAELARPFVLLGLGEKWIDIVPMVQVFSVMFAVGSITTALQSLAMATNRNELLFKRELLGFVVKIPFVLLGFMVAGVLGVALARAATGLIGAVFALGIVHSTIGLSVWTQISNNWRTFLSTGCMILACTILKLLEFGDSASGHACQIAVVAASGAIAYLAAVASLWIWTGRPAGPEAEVLRLLRRILRRGKAA